MEKQICENDLKIDEVANALKQLLNDKSSGSDGFTINFYKFFWPDIKKLPHESFVYSFKKGELTNDQKRGIINLIPKEGKDLRYLQNWRPLSLLNTIDFTLPVQDSVDIANLTHSTVLSEKGSLFQGHIYPIHSLDQGSQALRAIMQDPVFAKSDHILYAYEYVDGDGQLASGYYDDGEWTGSQILSEVLRQRNVNNAILIVTRVHGGTNLGKARFDLIRRVAADALDKFTDHKIE